MDKIRIGIKGFSAQNSSISMKIMHPDTKARPSNAVWKTVSSFRVPSAWRKKSSIRIVLEKVNIPAKSRSHTGDRLDFVSSSWSSASSTRVSFRKEGRRMATNSVQSRIIGIWP